MTCAKCVLCVNEKICKFLIKSDMGESAQLRYDKRKKIHCHDKPDF